MWLKGSEEADYEWNDGAVNDYYKGEMPKWLSNENQQRCYVVTLFYVASNSQFMH